MDIRKGEEFILQQKYAEKVRLLPVQIYFFLGCEISNNKTGNKMRLVSVAENKVTEVSQPRDCVPPKPLKQKMIKPAIKTSDVYKILKPVFLIVSDTVVFILRSCDGSSCL